jgi:CHAD domain-containing protein
MSGEIESIRRLAGALRENLVKCAADPDVDAVHDTRTGTRRLQALLENLVREMPAGEAGERVRDAAKALMRQLKRIRRTAGSVRDLDVHRKLLEKLAAKALGEKEEKDESEKEEPAAGNEPPRLGTPDVLEAPEAGLRMTPLHKHADDLDAWLKHQRAAHADQLRAQAADLVAKFDKRRASLEEAMEATPQRRKAQRPGTLALDSFARLATEMQLLDEGNLHDFRKGAKKARYVAELAEQADAHAGAVGKALKKLQDEIGDWHDWLVLAEEAHAALEEDAAELTGLIEAKREEHFVAAMKTAARLRGRLMGEWLAGSAAKKRPSRKRPAEEQPEEKRPAKKRQAARR